MKLFSVCAAALLATQAAGAAITHKLNGFTLTEHEHPAKRELLQQYVTWDEKSLFIKGERVMVFGAEIHPWRLPVPSLWIDIFQKVKALGFNAISFYADWAVLEGKPGEYRAEGSLAWEPFFEAAMEMGVYLIARPGPYINAESSGGGFPGWLQRVNGTLRAYNKPYLDATENYISHIAGLIAKYQITEGGPIILYQPENEYSGACCGSEFPSPDYFQYVIDQARRAGVVVPIISNDAWPGAHNAPGTGKGEVDIYGHDNYPIGFDCANPYAWPVGALPTDYRQQHLLISPSTPYTLTEFQAGGYQPWGGSGFDGCAILTNNEFERVVYKNTLSFGVSIIGFYMTFGGTNWGNIGHNGGYTSYDYGSPITESRELVREKYSELKLIGNFVKSAPSYLLATPGNLTTSLTSTVDLSVTPLIGDGTGSFYIVRHTDYTSQESTPYTISLATSAGVLTVPQLGGSLTLNGRDSKIHLVDFDVAGTNVLYSTAELFTWKKFGHSKVLILFGGPGEHHELAVSSASKVTVLEGSKSSITSKKVGGSMVVAWDVEPTRRIVQVGDLTVFLLDRNSAYNYWVPQLGDGKSTPYANAKTIAESVIIKAGYLVRTAHVQGPNLYITADFNATTPIEVIGAPSGAKGLFINGKQAKVTVDTNGIWSTEVKYHAPKITLPSLPDLDWKYLDTLPEAQADYDDSAWPKADRPTQNSMHPLQTPTSLYGSDYGFNTGYLIFRGHFIANGQESVFHIRTTGGAAFGSSVWLSGEYLGSWTGLNAYGDYNSTYSLPSLKAGKRYVFTVVVDNLGMNGNWVVGQDDMKSPRGILSYDLDGHKASDITWKLTGNFLGEDYPDKTRGPLNEGGLYAERHGYHQPYPPSQRWESASPLDGLTEAGIGFYTASFDLDIPKGWDVPLTFNLANTTVPAPAYRVQLYVNGWQYGKYINTIGPQTRFPVPEGVLNYQGKNWVAVTLWAQEETGAKLESFELTHTTPVQTTLNVKAVGQPRYQPRRGVY